MINIKNDDKKYFLWCHIRHLNALWLMALILNVQFLVSKEEYSKIEKKNSICINVFGYANGLVNPVHVLDEKCEDFMDLLLIANNNKSHYVYINVFNRFIDSKY